MSSLSANAILAKARSMYSYHLTEKDYEELTKKRTVNDLVAYLRSETGYSEALSKLKGSSVRREELEAVLSEEAFSKLSRMIRYASKKDLEFYRLGLIEAELDLLMNKVSQIINNQNSPVELTIPGYLVRNASFNLYGLYAVKTYDELLALIKNTSYYLIFKKFRPNGDEKIDYNLLSRALKKEYYDHYIKVVKKLFRGSVQKDLLTMLYTIIELQNISKIYRLKKYFNADSEDIRKMLFLEYSRIPVSTMNQMIEAEDVEDFLTILARSPYKLYIDDNDYVFIEYHAEKIVYNLAKRFMRFSTNSALVYMTYKFVQNVEIDNLKHIIEGLRYGQSASQIQEMLIY